jgi:carbon-monoxide dehydrogenase small subunit
MSIEEKNEIDPKEEYVNLSRREFLKNAGFVVGGATLGSMAVLSACSGTTKTETITKTVGGGAGATVTVTQAAGGASAVEGMIHLIVNGIDYWGKVQPEWTLAYVLREKMGLTGTKRGCDMGDCGLCTVIVDGIPLESCIYLAIEADGKKIETVEGLTTGDKLSPLQNAFLQNDGLQCGFCTPGMLMTAKALLAFKPKATEAEIREHMAGCLCRCGSYLTIIKSIKSMTA